MEEYIFGDASAKNVLIQMTGEHELAGLEQEYASICQISGRSDFCLTAIRVDDWNNDLSPWKAPAVFGNGHFGDGAENTLDFLLDAIIPELTGTDPDRKFFIGGYSMAGLFVLWSVFRCNVFAGAAAASPSVWFPGFHDYIRTNKIQTDAVYLSLGDREEKTRNPVLSQVGNAIRDLYLHIQNTETKCVLEWNPGNHFKNPGLRMVKAFAWLLVQKQI